MFSFAEIDKHKRIDKIVEGFPKSKYNDIVFDGSNLEAQVMIYVKSTNIPYSASDIEYAIQRILESCQSELRYRFEDYCETEINYNQDY